MCYRPCIHFRPRTHRKRNDSLRTIQQPNASSAPADHTTWCRDSRGDAYDFDSFLALAREYHGYPAPGLLIGGKMVSLALAELPRGILFDAVVETGNCLPDAIQMLTPCTAGNGWLKVLPLERFALALYDKQTGMGVRVYLDPTRVAQWPMIDAWFFKRRPKAEQNDAALREEIRVAGAAVLKTTAVGVGLDRLAKTAVGPRGLCPRCGESYPLRHGDVCRACGGASPYIPN